MSGRSKEPRRQAPDQSSLVGATWGWDNTATFRRESQLPCVGPALALSINRVEGAGDRSGGAHG